MAIRRNSKTSLNFALAREFVESGKAPTDGEVYEFVKDAKRGGSGVVAMHLNRVIDGKKVLARVKVLLKASNPKTDSLEQFAVKALKAAKESKGKFHNIAFISKAWEEMPGKMTLPQFKLKLIEAHKDGLLELSRADLVEAMNPKTVKDSETMRGEARFHFIREYGS